MAGSAPNYDNVRWPGSPSTGLRVPQEQAPATLAVINQANINVGGSGSTNTVNLLPTQTLATELVVTNAGSGATTLVWPAAFPGFVFSVYNNSGQALNLEVTGQSAITGPANGTRAMFVIESANVARLTPDISVNGPISPAPVAAGATLTLTAANAGATILLNQAAGSVVTLPAATGTGNKFNFVVSVTTTSNKDAILAASSSDFIQGSAIGENSGTAKVFTSTASSNHSIQMPFTGTQPSGGFIGDHFDLQDIATGVWQCNGVYQAGTTPTTPFSTATS